MNEIDATADPIPAARDGRSFLTHPAVLGALIVLLAVIAYANAIDHPFVYDDLPLVLKNPSIRSLANIPEMVGFTDHGFEMKARWTRMVLYTLEYALVGTQPQLYHATNVALHALVGLLAFVFIRRLAASAVLAFWSAALFVVHPITTEVVAHVAGRRDLLAAFFTLGAFVLLERYLAEGGRWRVAIALAAFYLGAFSKEVALVGPAAFGAVDLWRRRRATGAGTLPTLATMLRERWMLYGVLAAFSLAVGSWMLFGSASAVGMSGSPGYYDTLGQSLGLAQHARLIGLALRLIVVPLGQSVDYSYDALGLATGGLGSLGLLDLGVLLAAGCAAIWGWRRANWAGLAGCWCLLFLIPHVGLIPWHEIFAERFLYLPAIGLCAAVAAGAAHVLRSRCQSAHVAVVGAAVLVLLTTGTVLRNRVWNGPQPLWESAVARYPNCARANKSLGDVRMQLEARPDLALEHYATAVRILPRYRDAQIGVALARTAGRDIQGGLADVERILTEWPREPKAWNLKGYLLQSMGKEEEARLAYEQAVESDPTFAEGYNNLAQIHAARGDIPKAIELYEHALAIDPAQVTALRNLVVVYREGLKDDEQAKVYENRLAQLKRVR